MVQSMTGFGSKEAQVGSIGKISVELRSSNHKFFESVFHLPEGFLCLEERIKKEIELKIKRGRITCAINVVGGFAQDVMINKQLLKKYLSSIAGVKKQFNINDEISINTLMHLPGILSLQQSVACKEKIWPKLKILVAQAVNDLVKTRQKEGRALCVFLSRRAELLKQDLAAIKKRFNTATKIKLRQLVTDEERVSFLKDADIAEEIDRLTYHIRNFKQKLTKNVAVGKELDFIAQEMQREANTLAAKSFDTAITARVVQIKSQIEKIREQVQNIE